VKGEKMIAEARRQLWFLIGFLSVFALGILFCPPVAKSGTITEIWFEAKHMIKIAYVEDGVLKPIEGMEDVLLSGHLPRNIHVVKVNINENSPDYSDTIAPSRIGM
jgi:hypothetical protein